MTRVLVVDDHPLFRDGIVALLATVPDMDVVAAVGTGRRPSTPPSAGIPMSSSWTSTFRACRASRPRVGSPPHRGPAVLVLTMVDDDDSVVAALQVGARGYVLKGASQEEVLAAIRTVAAGGAVFGQRVAERVLRTRHPRTSLRLTEREAPCSRCSPTGGATRRSRASSASPSRPSRTT